MGEQGKKQLAITSLFSPKGSNGSAKGKELLAESMSTYTGVELPESVDLLTATQDRMLETSKEQGSVLGVPGGPISVLHKNDEAKDINGSAKAKELLPDATNTHISMESLEFAGLHTATQDMLLESSKEQVSWGSNCENTVLGAPGIPISALQGSDKAKEGIADQCTSTMEGMGEVANEMSQEKMQPSSIKEGIQEGRHEMR